MTTPDRWARLDAFLQKLQGDIYPEPASRVHNQITAQAFEWVQKNADLPPGGRVLDIGCGQGVALELFTAGGLTPVGITLGEDLEVCRARGFEVLEMDLSFLEFPDETFDLVWCRHALEHSIFPYFTLSEMRRVVKPGGCIYVEVPAPDTTCAHQTNPNHYSVMGKSMWLELMKRLRFREIRTIDLAFESESGPDTYWSFLLKA